MQTDERTEGQTDRQTGRRIDTMKLIVPFRDLANAPEKDSIA